MGWNESANGNKNDKDPWGNRRHDGPPDLDKIIGDIRKGWGAMFGKRPGGPKGQHPVLAWGIGFAILFIWLIFDVVYLVDQQQRGIVLRFGRYVETLDPGLNIRFPRPVERVYKVNVGQVRSITHKATMLTQDENIVDVEVAVQWRISAPEDYLFNVYAQTATLRQVTESVVREVIGKSKLDFVLTEGRNEIAQRQQVLIQETLNSYESGILVVSVEMQPARPPEAVKAAFDDAIKAREDEQRLVNEAEAYRNEVIPQARGSAARLHEEADAYKARVIAKAEGEASRFEQLLFEYKQAPTVTRERLYLDAIEGVFQNTSKVLIDDKSGNNSLMYLPIDKILENRKRSLPGESVIPKEFKPDNMNGKSTFNALRDRSDRARGER